MPTIHDRLMTAIRREAEAEKLWDRLPTNGRIPSGSPLEMARQVGLSEAAVARATAKALEVEYLEDLVERPASAVFVESIPIHFARKHRVLGLAGDNGVLPVAVASLEDFTPLDVLARHLGKPVEPILAPPEVIGRAINSAYQKRQGQAQGVIDNLDRELGADFLGSGDLAEHVARMTGREDLLDVATRAPVIKLVNLLLFEAVKLGASDLHLQPYEDKLTVRLRINGVLFDCFTLPKAMQEEVLSRVKVMGRMNIAEKRLPQDGRATVQVGDRVIDLRLASLPASHGEHLVVRLLDKSARLYTLDELGMPPPAPEVDPAPGPGSDTRIGGKRAHQPMALGMLEAFRGLIRLEHGLILVTGPTGSGKSTTLYGALQELNAKELNIVTLEDPIEYQLPGVSQTQVSEKKGLTFARGLRSVLRLDPDIIMVGEIRDHETAVMAIQSALTGHLVFSTLHTNDAGSAVTRLLDLGIEPYLVSSSLIGVLAQRLVRRVCDECGQPVTLEADELERVGISVEQLGQMKARKGIGCEFCRMTGFRGRVGIFELLLVDDAIRRHIQARDTAAQIRQAAIEAGMTTLRDDGILKVRQGVTTLDEVVRVTMRGG